ncbi:hypothetical protein SLA2020_447040 [Shorea laevis]
MEDFNGLIPPTQLEFEKVAFWVRMYNLPLACMGTDIGFKIGSSVGMVEEVDTNEDGVGWGEYLRVRIILDITKPLARGRILKLQGNPVWIAFQYEKIPKFCFRCGIIRHGAEGCLRSRDRRFQGEDPAAQFGAWLRANSPTRGSTLIGQRLTVRRGSKCQQAAVPGIHPVHGRITTSGGGRSGGRRRFRALLGGHLWQDLQPLQLGIRTLMFLPLRPSSNAHNPVTLNSKGGYYGGSQGPREGKIPEAVMNDALTATAGELNGQPNRATPIMKAGAQNTGMIRKVQEAEIVQTQGDTHAIFDGCGPDMGLRDTAQAKIGEQKEKLIKADLSQLISAKAEGMKGIHVYSEKSPINETRVWAMVSI